VKIQINRDQIRSPQLIIVTETLTRDNVFIISNHSSHNRIMRILGKATFSKTWCFKSYMEKGIFWFVWTDGDVGARSLTDRNLQVISTLYILAHL
jgi:hypothetical protein